MARLSTAWQTAQRRGISMGEKGKGPVCMKALTSGEQVISSQCKAAAKQEHLAIQAETMSSRMQINHLVAAYHARYIGLKAPPSSAARRARYIP